MTSTYLSNLKLRWDKILEERPGLGILVSTALFGLILVLILTFASDRFLTVRNITNIFNQFSVYLILAVGMTLVMDTGGIDISVGSMVGIGTVILGTAVIRDGMAWWVGILLVMVGTTACGLFNALFVVKFKVPAIIVPLGTLTMFRGIAYVYQEGQTYFGFPPQIVWFSRTRLFGLIPLPVILSLVILVAGHIFLTRTRTGRHLSAVGGNEKAARLSGINVGFVRGLAFVIMGVLAGIAAVLNTARLDASQAVAGTGYELHVIASVVVGGTSLFGGKSLMIGTFLGVLILGILENGLLLAGVSYYFQRVFLGLIFILVVAFRTVREKREEV